jgi:hypothetical protein
MPVEASQVTDALDKVQRTGQEEKYRNIRREVFNFDEVNGQRRVICVGVKLHFNRLLRTRWKDEGLRLLVTL